MARPKKTGLDYFPFDVDFFSNKKIKILRARYGTNGIAVLLFLYCEIYRNGYYVIWDDDYKAVIADELNVSDDFVEQVLRLLIEKSVIHIAAVGNYKYLTSGGVQRRYQLAVKQRAARRKSIIAVDSRIWMLSGEETESFICPVTNGDFSCDKSPKESKVKKSKVKKSKVKKSKVNESKADESKENHSAEEITREEVDCVVKLFNTICTDLDPVENITPEAREYIIQILNNYGKFDFRNFFERVERSDFLTGRNRRWFLDGTDKAFFNWIIKPGNVDKILSGRFDNKSNSINSYDESDTSYDDYLEDKLKSYEP